MGSFSGSGAKEKRTILFVPVGPSNKAKQLRSAERQEEARAASLTQASAERTRIGPAASSITVESVSGESPGVGDDERLRRRRRASILAGPLGEGSLRKPRLLGI